MFNSSTITVTASEYQGFPCQWTNWINTIPKGSARESDSEFLVALNYYGLHCERYFDFEARRSSDKVNVNDIEDLVMTDLTISRGMNCKDEEQPNNQRCPDLEVRACCQCKKI